MKLKRIIAGLLAMVMLLTATLPTSNVKAASGTASLDSLGKLGTVNVGSKSESGIWLQTLVNEKPVLYGFGIGMSYRIYLYFKDKDN